VAAKRIILTEPIAELFLNHITKAFSEIEPSSPFDELTGYGSLCTLKVAEELENLINQSVEADAKVLVGGKRNGAFIEPTKLTSIQRGCSAFEEELSGPFAVVFTIPDETATIELANDTPFGFGGSVYTSDEARGRRVVE